ncbi:MAG: ATP-binding cassette domain-containing protein [Candidatus Latescibacteria bacterium]|nr:ATP-binding cassette domain-containing protein [Candidatus Latescibacterota bacterium]
MNPLIEIRDLHVAYGDTHVLRGIDLRVEAGEIVVILGGSGCGKSTLLKSIIGLAPVHEGRIDLLGQPLDQLDEKAARALLQRIGVMFQYGALMNSLSVAENIALPLEMHTDLPAELIDGVVRTLLHLVGIGHAYSQLPAELSGGMRKRAALARSLALNPQILFCDEPGAGLDPVTAAEIDRLLLMLNQSLGTTLVIVTHELLSIDRLDGRLIMLDEGQVAFTGRLDQARVSELPLVRGFFNPNATAQP